MPRALRLRASRRRMATAAGAAALAALLPGCASLRRVVDGYRDSYRAAPDAIGGEWVRRSLERGAFDSAFVRLTGGRDAPADELLRSLYAATAAHYGGRLVESASAFAAADAVAEDRYTKSLTSGALSLLTSDVAMPYNAGRTERLLVHYYGVLGYLKRDSAAAAAVEARRLGKLLETYGESRAAEERATHALLHYLAGAAFEAAGERGDAAVAYRNAAALGADSVRVDSLPRARGARAGARPAGRPTGDVVVVVEQGFVGYRAQESVVLGFDSADVVHLASGKADTSFAARLAHRLAERRARPAAPPAGGQPNENAAGPTTFPSQSASSTVPVLRQVLLPDAPKRRRGEQAPVAGTPPLVAVPSAGQGARERERGGPGYVLRMAWPTFVRPRPAALPLAVVAAGDTSAAVPLRFRADLSDAAERDFERQRAALVARSAARAAAKYWASRAARKKGGELSGVITNAATALLERADTRSWHLLPATISVARLSLPAGRHYVSVEVPAAGGVTHLVRVGEVVVHPGRVAVLSTRLWRDRSAGAAPALRAPAAPRVAVSTRR